MIPPPPHERNDTRRGSALVLVLAVLVTCVALAGGMQHRLMSRSRFLAMEAAEIELRAALILGLREGMERWSGDGELTVAARGEPKGDTREWITDTGVRVTVHLRDAQDRLNLNHLTLPVTPEHPRSAMDMLEDLLAETDPDAPPETFLRFRETLEEMEPWFSGVDTLEVVEPGARGWTGARPFLTALPHPRGRWLPVNVNTAPPPLLHAMLGDSFKPWVNSLVQAREGEPIRDLDNFLRFLPVPARRPVDRVLDVRSTVAELHAVAEYDNTRRDLTAWLRRAEGGDVEVLKCRW